MGTSLNGLTPASTYQGLLKTTDNTAISSTVKRVTDGAGNDTGLLLSNQSVSSYGIGNVTTNTVFGINCLTTNGTTTNSTQSVIVGTSILQGEYASTRSVAIGWRTAAGMGLQSSVLVGTIGAFSSNALSQSSVAIGVNIGANTNLIDSSVVIGSGSAFQSNQITYSVVIGADNITSQQFPDNEIIIGYSNLVSDTYGANNVVVGNNNFFTNTSMGSIFNNILVGSNYSIAAESDLTFSLIIGDNINPMSSFIDRTINIGHSNNITGGSIIIGHEAIAGYDQDFVIGSVTYPVGTISTETVTSNRTWTIQINGNYYKVLLQAI